VLLRCASSFHTCPHKDGPWHNYPLHLTGHELPLFEEDVVFPNGLELLSCPMAPAPSSSSSSSSSSTAGAGWGTPARATTNIRHLSDVVRWLADPKPEVVRCHLQWVLHNQMLDGRAPHPVSALVGRAALHI
jgi:hypothetical protein